MSVEIGGQTLALDPELVAERPALRNYVGDKVAVGIRSEDMSDAAQTPERAGRPTAAHRGAARRGARLARSSPTSASTPRG